MRRVTLPLALLLIGLSAPLERTASAGPPLAVYVIVVDGLRPSEVGVLTPALAALRDQGTWYEESRAVMVAETIPNHVAMMTGVYPERSGITANEYWDRRGEPDAIDLSDPRLLSAPTLFTTLAKGCRSYQTAAALSKRYLFEIFSKGGRNVAPGDHWDPRPSNLPEPDGHTIDVLTTDAAIERVATSDFLFVNLGDVDRSAHVDVTGPTGVPAFRTFALMQTDRQVARLVQAIHDAGRWEQSVVIVLSDHGFDWSTPDRFIHLQPDLPEGVAAIENGGADLLYLRPGTKNAPAVLRAARDAALAHPGVEHAWYRRPNPADRRPGSVLPASLHLAHPHAGDLIVTARQGWRVSDPDPQTNPIPGNHGHLATRHNTFMVTGGAPFVRRGATIEPSKAGPGPMDTLREQSENVDVAPTVAWLLGLPTSGYQGRVLREAFAAPRSPTRCGIAGAG